MQIAYRVGVWAAVSSKQQATEDKTSLDDQLRAGERFASAVGGAVVATYVVPGHSRDVILWADACEQMPAYAALYDDWKHNRIDILHAVSADRLGRDAALVQAFYSLAAKHGCEVYLGNAPHMIGQQTTLHRIIPAFLGLQAQSENEAKVMRQKSGMRGRVIKRGLIGAEPPFGYVKRGDSYEVDEAARGTILALTGWFLQGLPYTQILQAANRAGLPAPDGGRWVYSSTRRLLMNDTYAGMPHWAQQQRAEPSELYPAIWDAETYRAIVLERARRKRGYSRRGCSPLAGIAFCAQCGKRMTRLNNHGYLYLRCSTHARRSMGEQGECHANTTPERRVMAAVAEWFAREVTEEDVRAEYQRRLAGATDLLAEMQAERAAIAEIRRKRERLALAYAGGAMPIDIYRRADETLHAQEAAHGETLRRQEAEVAAVPDIEQRVRETMELAAHFEEMAAEWPAASVAKALQSIGLRVLVERGRVVSVTT